MKFHYDKKKDALSIRFSDGNYQESNEVAEGIMFDYDSRGKIVAMEILDASRVLSIKNMESELTKSRRELHRREGNLLRVHKALKQ